MFGYIKLDKKCSKSIKTIFKKNYCVLCRSIEQNYGQLSRFMLSFDVTFMMILFSNQHLLESVEKVHCFKNRKTFKTLCSNEIIKKCAALNLAMAQAELLDHINDDKSFLAKTLLFIYKRPFRKVKNEYPDMWKRLMESYSRFDEYEKANRPLEDLENLFSNLITSIALKDFNIKDIYTLRILSYVSKWLYFIDACDDLDKDIKSSSFNPLKKYESCHKLFCENYAYISKHINEIKDGLSIENIPDANRYVVNRIVFWGLPESTLKVIQRKTNDFVC